MSDVVRPGWERAPELPSVREGTLQDVRDLINGAELVRLWEKLWLPGYLRRAWQPLIDAARAAA